MPGLADLINKNKINVKTGQRRSDRLAKNSESYGIKLAETLRELNSRQVKTQPRRILTPLQILNQEIRAHIANKKYAEEETPPTLNDFTDEEKKDSYIKVISENGFHKLKTSGNSNNCLIHAFLMEVSDRYRMLKSYDNKNELAEWFRKEKLPIYYDQLLGKIKNQVDIEKINYAKNQLSETSDAYNIQLPNDHIMYLAMCFNINIIPIDRYNSPYNDAGDKHFQIYYSNAIEGLIDTKKNIYNGNENQKNPYIFIYLGASVGNDGTSGSGHFEAIAKKTNDIYQYQLKWDDIKDFILDNDIIDTKLLLNDQIEKLCKEFKEDDIVKYDNKKWKIFNKKINNSGVCINIALIPQEFINEDFSVYKQQIEGGSTLEDAVARIKNEMRFDLLLINTAELENFEKVIQFDNNNDENTKVTMAAAVVASLFNDETKQKTKEEKSEEEESEEEKSEEEKSEEEKPKDESEEEKSEEDDDTAETQDDTINDGKLGKKVINATLESSNYINFTAGKESHELLNSIKLRDKCFDILKQKYQGIDTNKVTLLSITSLDALQEKFRLYYIDGNNDKDEYKKIRYIDFDNNKVTGDNDRNVRTNTYKEMLEISQEKLEASQKKLEEFKKKLSELEKNKNALAGNALAGNALAGNDINLNNEIDRLKKIIDDYESQQRKTRRRVTEARQRNADKVISTTMAAAVAALAFNEIKEHDVDVKNTEESLKKSRQLREDVDKRINATYEKIAEQQKTILNTPLAKVVSEISQGE
jgi:hypothetical protein